MANPNFNPTYSTWDIWRAEEVELLNQFMCTMTVLREVIRTTKTKEMTLC